MSSGMQNAQNFAAIISSMVLEPSFFDHFLDFGFSRDVFPKKGHLARLAPPPGAAAPPCWGSQAPKNKEKGFWVLGELGGGLPPGPYLPTEGLRIL